jgi:hypothetical protein
MAKKKAKKKIKPVELWQQKKVPIEEFLANLKSGKVQFEPGPTTLQEWLDFITAHFDEVIEAEPDGPAARHALDGRTAATKMANIVRDPESAAKKLYLLIRLACDIGITATRIEAQQFGLAVALGEAAQVGRRKGGKNTQKLTAEQRHLAKKVIEGYCTPGVSWSAACVRASAVLLKTYRIEISHETLRKQAKSW